MDDIRASLSRTKKKFKQRLTGKKRKPDGTGDDPGGEMTDSAPSLPQPELFSTDRPPQPDGPESVPARGSDNCQERGEIDIDGGEASQMDSRSRSDVEVAVGSGRSGEPEGVYPPPSSPSVSHGAEPDST